MISEMSLDFKSYLKKFPIYVVLFLGFRPGNALLIVYLFMRLRVDSVVLLHYFKT